MSLVDGLGHAGAGAAFAGAGVVFVGMFVGIFALPALGFVVGWFAKLFLPKNANFFSLINYTLMAILILGPVLLVFASVLLPEMKRKSEKNLVRQELKRKSELKNISELNLTKNMRVPVKFGDNLLVLPFRGDANFGYFSLERMKTKMLEGPIQTNRLTIRGYKSHYLPLSDFPHSSTSKNSRNTSKDCLLVENEETFRCNFIKPEFSLEFRYPSKPNDYERDKSLDSIRVIDEFEVVKEEWRKSKTKNETPQHMLFTLRDFSKDESSGLVIPNFTKCIQIVDYKCTARINPINGKPKINYEFRVREAADIPIIIRRTRNIANDYWDELLKTHSVEEMDVQ